MIRLKNEGVRARIGGISNEMLFALMVIEGVFRYYGVEDVVVTAGTEGSRSRVKGSRHIIGQALDFRTRHWPDDHRTVIPHEIRQSLGPDYDVVLEKDHLHVEYDPQPLEF